MYINLMGLHLFAVSLILIGSSCTPQEEKRVAVEPPAAAAKKDPNVVEDFTNAKPDYTLTPKKMNDEYAADSEAYIKKYDGKLLEISGVVTDFDPSYANESATLVMRTGGDIFDLAKFECREDFPMARVLPGQSIVLRGRIHAPGIVDPMQIIKVSGDPPPSFTPAELEKAIKDDKEALKKKLRPFGDYVLLTGSIKSVERDGKEIRSLQVVGADDSKIESRCLLNPRMSQIAEQRGLLNVGAQVKLLGLSIGPTLDLSGCLIILPAEPRKARKLGDDGP